MNDINELKSSHKDIAMDLLLSVNTESDAPISPEIIEKVYDLFYEKQSESVTYQRNLEKLINP